MGKYHSSQSAHILINKAGFFVAALLMLIVSCRSARQTVRKREPLHGRVNAEKKLGIPLPAAYDEKLVNSLSRWIGSPYRYGGETTEGTDCSGMVKAVYSEVYNLRLEHNAARQKSLSRPVKEDNLKEGDLVFFSISSKKTDHVGIYLWEGYFVHASTKKGVTVSRLSEPYYRKTFTGAGTYRH